jgi:2-polyprenyl-3-methyl-5-hydroxy-6-metoxy-1,4-benzoquinol methylase
MSKENEFLIFAVEYYRNAKNLTGQQVAELLAAHDVYRMILDNYFLYHIESPDSFVAEIDKAVSAEGIGAKVKR